MRIRPKPEPDVDWAALARTPGTLVFLMGVGVAGREHGPAGRARACRRRRRPRCRPRHPARPATVVATVATIAEAAAGRRMRGRPRSRWSARWRRCTSGWPWFERRPLFGRRVVVTRARAQASGLARRLSDLGAQVIEAPAIRIEPLPYERPDLAADDILVVTSVNGVELLLAGDVRCLRDAVRGRDRDGHGGCAPQPWYRARRAARPGVSESLLEALGGVAGQRVLIATAGTPGPCCPTACESAARRSRCCTSTARCASRWTSRRCCRPTSSPSRPPPPWTRSSTPSTRPERASLRAVSIGPITTRSLRARGVEPAVEADPHDVDGLVDAVLRAAAVE